MEPLEIGIAHPKQTPDALIAATAISCKASAFLTNDPVFRRIPNLEALLIDDYV
jgi:predicted nucleic acid-binding protein